MSETAVQQRLVVFSLARGRYALPLDDVVEVQRVVATTPLPRAPEVVEGVIDLRGTLVPVLDIRRRFGLPPRPVAQDDHLLIAQAASRTVAIRVDRALGVQEVAAADLDHAIADVPGVAHVLAAAQDAEGIVLIHDLATFLSWEEAAALDDAMTRARTGR